MGFEFRKLVLELVYLIMLFFNDKFECCSLNYIVMLGLNEIIYVNFVLFYINDIFLYFVFFLK